MQRTFVGGVLDALERFEKAVRADEMKGGGYPEDIPIIEFELLQARDDIEEFLSQIN